MRNTAVTRDRGQCGDQVGDQQLARNLYEFFRNKVLNSNEYCLTATEGLPCDKPQFNQNQFGGTFGGPIKKIEPSSLLLTKGAVSARASLRRRSLCRRPRKRRLHQRRERADCRQLHRCEPDFPHGAIFWVDYQLLDFDKPSWVPGGQRCDWRRTYSGWQHIREYVPAGLIPLACMDATAVDLLQFVPARPATVI